MHVEQKSERSDEGNKGIKTTWKHKRMKHKSFLPHKETLNKEMKLMTAEMKQIKDENKGLKKICSEIRDENLFYLYTLAVSPSLGG